MAAPPPDLRWHVFDDAHTHTRRRHTLSSTCNPVNIIMIGLRVIIYNKHTLRKKT